MKKFSKNKYIKEPFENRKCQTCHFLSHIDQSGLQRTFTSQKKYILYNQETLPLVACVKILPNSVLQPKSPAVTSIIDCEINTSEFHPHEMTIYRFCSIIGLVQSDYGIN